MNEMGTTPIKYMILMIPGLSDVPSEHLDGKTPLEAAATPSMDAISSMGRIGRVETVAGDSVGGSDKAILSILGYDPDGAWSDRYGKPQRGTLVFNWFGARQALLHENVAYFCTDYHVLAIDQTRLPAISAAECREFEAVYKHLGIGIGAARTSIDFKAEGSDPFRVSYNYGGFMAYLAIAF